MTNLLKFYNVYTILSGPISMWFWIIILVQMAIVSTNLFYYMRKNHVLHTVLVIMMPIGIYGIIILLYGQTMSALLMGTYKYASEFWSCYNECDLNIWIVLLDALFVGSIYIENKLFAKIEHKAHPVINIVRFIDGLANWVMIIYVTLYHFTMRTTFEKWKFCLQAYCIFTLVIQIIAKFVLIIIGNLEAEKNLDTEIETRVMDSEWCRKKVKGFIASSYRTLAYVFGIMAITLSVTMIDGVIRDIKNGMDIIYEIPLVSMYLLPVYFLTIFFSIKWIFPTKQATWKRMRTWGSEIEINRLICKEFFNEKKPPKKSMLVWTTEHFILSPVIANRKLYYIPKYIGTRFEGNKRIHCFDDGGKIVLESTQSGNDMIFSAVRRWQNNKI
ncbi:MAG: hypothetical protein SOW32_10840 [Agathobacter sp.]|nr:hypothetical protein [Agathobacter sp.]